MNSSDVIVVSSDEEGNIEDGCSNVCIKQQIPAQGNIQDNCTNASIKQDFFASPNNGAVHTKGRTANTGVSTQLRNGTCQSIRLDPLLASFAGAHQPPFGMAVAEHAAQGGPTHQLWKAGDYDIQPNTNKTVQAGLDKIKIHPIFLHSNATAHKWELGAIAELLDNAVDEIQNGATYVSVDSIRNPRDNSSALVVQDDGGGMDPDCMRQCMCLGYSQKNKRHTIGQYGNGFKTSAMRLGADVIVFSSSNHNSIATQSIGLLSSTFLRETRHEDVVFAMVDDVEPHGTKVIIYNLQLNEHGQTELEFESDPEDIQLRRQFKISNNSNIEKELDEKHIANRLRYSLRNTIALLMISNFVNKSHTSHKFVEKERFQ